MGTGQSTGRPGPVEIDSAKGIPGSSSTGPLAQSSFGNEADERWVKELILHIDTMHRVLEIRHTDILSKLSEIRRIFTRVEVLSARQLVSNIAAPIQAGHKLTGLARAGIFRLGPIQRVGTRPDSDNADLTALTARAETLLLECERIDRGETDDAGPEVNWARLDRMMALARSGSIEFRGRTEGVGSYTEGQEAIAKYDPWISSNPRVIRVIFDQLKEDLKSIRLDLAQRKWERWLQTVQNRSQRIVLTEVWPILQLADRPLVRREIIAKLKTVPDDSILGHALGLAADPDNPDAPIRNRKKKPQGYFIPDHFPHLIDPSK
jgi:hypothetical protein